MTRHQLKPQPTAADRIRLKEQRLAAKRKLAEAPRKDYYQLQKYAGLSYDYGQIAEADRGLVQQAALDIHRWQRDTLALGNTLLAVKEKLPHRQFLEWLKVEFDSGLRVLQQSMNVARMLKDDPKAHDRALLSADALYLLAAPSTPETVRWEVFERMEMLGHRPTRAQIKEIIDAHRPPRPKQLPGPVAEPEPDAISAEYTVAPDDEEAQAVAEVEAERAEEERLRLAMNRARDEPLTFAEWWAMMPKEEMNLANWLLIFQTAKMGAAHAGTLEPRLKLAAINVMVTWSKFVNAVEKELKNE